MNKFELGLQIIPSRRLVENYFIKPQILIDANLLEPDKDFDLLALLASFAVSGEHFIFTCACGQPDCAGIEQGVMVHHQNDRIIWHMVLPVSMGHISSDEDFAHWSATAVFKEYIFDRQEMIEAASLALDQIMGFMRIHGDRLELFPRELKDSLLMGIEAGKIPHSLVQHRHPAAWYFEARRFTRLDVRIVTLCPDHGGWAWCDPDAPDSEAHIEPIGNIDYWDGFRPLPVPLFKCGAEWGLDFERALIDNPEHLAFDWDKFHQRGRALAFEIKQALGEDVRIIYQKPTEDPGHEDQERIEILSDGKCLDLPSLHEGADKVM